MPRPPGSTATETRARILQAAGDLFRVQGYSATSMRDLAETLGITTAALYYHFDGKDAILDGLIAPFLDALRGLSETPTDPEALLTRLAGVLVEHGAAIHAVMNDPSARTHILKRRDFPEAMMRAERVLAGGDDPRDVLRARCALGSLHGGLIARGKRGGGPPSPFGPVEPPTDAEVATVVAFALAGLRSTSPTS